MKIIARPTRSVAGWHGAFELLRDGIVLGALYSLVALGYTIVYGILKLLNFAHGDVFMVGAFIGFGVLSVLSGPTGSSLPLIPLVIVIFVVAISLATSTSYR